MNAPRSLAALAALAVIITAAAPAVAGVHPCDLVRRVDLKAVLQWTYVSRASRTYTVARTSGAICTYAAKEGSILVTVPDYGSSFLANNDLVDPFNNGLGRRYAGHGYVMELFNDAAYVRKHGKSVAVQILPNEGSPAPDDVIALGKLVAKRMP